MPRSYFSRLARSDGGMLKPPRPVASLWKAARLDWLASSHATEDISVLRQNVDANSRPIESAAATASRRPARVHRQGLALDRQTTTPEKRLQLEPAIPQMESRAQTRSAKPAAGNRVSPEMRGPAWTGLQQAAGDSASSRSRQTKYRERPFGASSSVAPPSESRDMPRNSETQRSSSIQALPGSPAGESAKARSRIPSYAERPRADVRLAGIQQLNPEPPLSNRQRGPAAVLNPGLEADSGSIERNKIEIGKLEVQVIAPPVFRSAPSVPLSKTRLARGYALWPGC